MECPERNTGKIENIGKYLKIFSELCISECYKTQKYITKNLIKYIRHDFNYNSSGHQCNNINIY